MNTDIILLAGLAVICIAGLFILAGDALTKITAFLGSMIILTLLFYAVVTIGT